MEIAQPKKVKWATIIPQRYSQRQKHHYNLGHAKLALLYGWGDRARGGKLFEFINGEWELRLDIPPGSSCKEAKELLNAIEPLAP